MAQSPTIWEQRFPTFTGGSTPVAVTRPVQSATWDRRHAPVCFPLRPKSTGPVNARVTRRVVSRADATAEDRAALSFDSTNIEAGSRPAAAPAVPSLRLNALCGDTSRQSGYDPLLASMERLQAKLEHLPLHRRWEAMSMWLDKFSLDERAIQLATSAAKLHVEVVTQTKDRGPVNGMRTAIAFMLLEQVLDVVAHAFPKLLPLTVTVRDDMMRSVYVSPDTAVDLSSSFFELDDPSDPVQQERLIKRFYKKTYFQHLRDTAAKIKQKTLIFETTERTKDKQMRILNRVLDFWQLYTKRLVLRSWRGYLRGRRAKRELVQRYSALADDLGKASTAAHAAANDRDQTSLALMQRNEQLAEEVARLEAVVDGLTNARGVTSDDVAGLSIEDLTVLVQRLRLENAQLQREADERVRTIQVQLDEARAKIGELERCR